MITRFAGWLGVSAAAAFGATLAVWAQTPYPVTIVERNVLTPMVKPGEFLRVEIVADRRERCDAEAVRFVQEPDGDRVPARQIYSASFGRLGRDIYVVSIPTSRETPFGPAEVVTVGQAYCNPWHRWVAPVKSGDPSYDRFLFAPETVTVKGKYEGKYTR